MVVPLTVRLRLLQAQLTRPMALAASRAKVNGSGTTSAVTLSVSVCCPGPTAEVLFVRQIELILAGEVAQFRRIHEQILLDRSLCPVPKSAKGIASVPKTPSGSESTVTEFRSKACAVSGGEILDLILKGLRAATELQCPEVQRLCAAIGKGGRRMVEHGKRRRSRLRTIGGIRIAAGEGDRGGRQESWRWPRQWTIGLLSE